MKGFIAGSVDSFLSLNNENPTRKRLSYCLVVCWVKFQNLVAASGVHFTRKDTVTSIPLLVPCQDWFLDKLHKDREGL